MCRSGEGVRLRLSPINRKKKQKRVFKSGTLHHLQLAVWVEAVILALFFLNSQVMTQKQAVNIGLTESKGGQLNGNSCLMRCRSHVYHRRLFNSFVVGVLF